MTIQTLLVASALLALAASAQTAQPVLEVTSPLGTKFYSLPDEKGVVNEAAKNLAADPKNPGLIMKLEAAQVSVWQDREAVTTCTRALKRTPGNADIYTERGHRELPLRDFKHALADLNHAVALNPKKMDAYYHLGLAHYFLGEFQEAGKAFRHAVDLAPNLDERINSSNWLYASLRRAHQDTEAAQALAQITPEMKNTAEHTLFYLNLVRFFQRRLPESEALPPEPPAGNQDDETELRFDTVAYGVGNWHLYNSDEAKAQDYFARVVKGHVWVTWGFVGAEAEIVRARRH
ncbi:putative Tetratricopeptide TPR_2 repeat-containing protein [Candidatus Sulfopaludibacter sp. SbA6]|nr:putative Tetratricopeptide TPR_2 repeat-containing protein [Candidatus Sulfopaludibacter sp. SbA6]